MTIESLKEVCDKINVYFKGNLLFYHKEIVGRYYHTNNNELEIVCDIISIGSITPVEGLNNETEIENLMVKAIMYFKKLENNIKLKRINDDF